MIEKKEEAKRFLNIVERDEIVAEGWKRVGGGDTFWARHMRNRAQVTKHHNPIPFTCQVRLYVVSKSFVWIGIVG